MRLIAEELEHAGIATAVVGTMRSRLAGLPRVLLTRHGRGLNFGPAHDADEHASIASEALRMFDADEPVFHEHQRSA